MAFTRRLLAPDDPRSSPEAALETARAMYYRSIGVTEEVNASSESGEQSSKSGSSGGISKGAPSSGAASKSRSKPSGKTSKSQGSSSQPAEEEAPAGVPLRWSASLPSREDERSLEFLQQCELDPTVAQLLLGSRLGVGYDEDAMRLVATASTSGPRTRSGAAMGAGGAGAGAGMDSGSRRSGRGGSGGAAVAGSSSLAALSRSSSNGSAHGGAANGSASAAPNETDEEYARIGVLLGSESVRNQKAMAGPDVRGGLGELDRSDSESAVSSSSSSSSSKPKAMSEQAK